MRKVISLLMVGLILNSCSSLCDRACQVEIPADAINQAVIQASYDLMFEPAGWIPQQWWTIFDDSQLSLFIETALANNPTIHAACARIRAAQYEADRIQAALFPIITWTGDVLREKFSKTGLIQPPSSSSSLTQGVSSRTVGAAVPASLGAVPFYFTQYETAFNLTYDFDVWGKNRETLRAAIGVVRANIADEAFVRLNLSLALARTYFQLQIDYERELIAQQVVKNRQLYFNLIEDRIRSNLENNINLNNIERELASAKQILLQVQGNIAINEDQLRAYMAENFDEDILDVQVAKSSLPKVPLPREIPMHLLAHRPDIIAQLWMIESAGHQIEVAKAGFYPDFNLMSFFGFQTIHFKKWFWAKSSYWAVDPAFTLPIFDGGLLLADLHTSEVNYDLAVYQYNQLVLNAARDVLDGIAVLRNANQQLDFYQQEVTNQKEIANLTKQRVKYHLNSQLDFLNSERNVLITIDQEILALGNTIQAVLLLVKALGGGYDVCEVGYD